MAWHARHLLQHDLSKPLVLLVRRLHVEAPRFLSGARTAPIVCRRVCRVRPPQFKRSRRTIFTTRDGMAMDTFIVLEPDGARCPQIVMRLFGLVWSKY